MYHDIDISNVMDVSVHVSGGYRNITFVGRHFSKTDDICQFTKCIYPRYNHREMQLGLDPILQFYLFLSGIKNTAD